eukprot:CAMPEP_0117607152 /NCGR_PEP_ID=MMETSP0784-20121206/80099_1 /TAXON_ID=39447 /ORGANISM="" /LENGTH=215 /DNA_ID=CAMNT_0005410293 /DNA_START=82 /DNA_END=729 /DNA_ORIENTATION=+
MDIADDDAPTSREVALSVAAYTLCSSLAVVSNKVVLYHAPLPGMLFCVQILVTIVCTGALRCMRLIEVDALTKKNVGMFAPYIVAFVCALYANGMALSVSNVDTVIVFRASSPIMVSITDWLVLGRELPSFRSSVALLGVALGACGYVFTDSEFAMHGVSAYTWVLIYVGLAKNSFPTSSSKVLSGARPSTRTRCLWCQCASSQRPAVKLAGLVV